MSSEPSKGGSSCSCCPCSACNSCLEKIFDTCCPYLSRSGKDRYASIEYLPIEPVESEPPHESLMSARRSLQSIPVQHFPHVCDPASTIEEEDEYDYDDNVITTEPKSITDEKKPLVGSATTRRGSRLSRQDPMSTYSSEAEDDLGVELGFVDYDRSESFDDRDVRICRTPEPSFEGDDSVSEGYHLSIRTQSDERPKRAMSEEHMKKSDVAFTRGRCQQVEAAASPHKHGVYFSLYFDDKRNVLIAHVLKAFNLPTKRDESASNPFAEVYLLPNKSEPQESRVIYQCLSPVFDQAFKFTGLSLDEVRKQMLVVRVYLHAKHHFIGGIIFPLEKANLFGSSQYMDFTTFDEDEGLKDSCKGDILLSITHYPEAGTLEVLVLEASNLKKQDLIGLPNPYIKVNTILEGYRISKWKTGAQKNTLNPVFNELCVLDIGTMNTEELEVEVVVMDYDRFGRNSELGSISFGSNVSKESGRSHWKEIMNNPSVRHTYWHVLTIPEGSIGRLISPVRTRRSRSPVSCVSSAGK